MGATMLRHPRPRTWRLSACVAAAASTLLLVACGASPSAQQAGGDADARSEDQTEAEKAYAKFAGMSGDARRQALVEAAQDEGKLVIYTVNTNMKDIAPKFEEKYGIDVEIYRAPSEPLLQRVLKEAQAGRIENDVYENDAFALTTLAQQQLLAPYDSEIRRGMPESARFRQWTATFIMKFVVAWNTEQTANGTGAPTSFQDLAKPKWKGKLALEEGDYNWYATLYSHLTGNGMSDEDFAAMFRDMAANGRTVQGHPPLTDFLAAGEFSVAVSDYYDYVLRAQDEGAPLTVGEERVVEPVIQVPHGAGLMADAPHPAAAILFMDYYLTEGQQAIADARRTPANPDAVPGYQNPLPSGTEEIPVDLDAWVNQNEQWQQAYQNLLSGKGEVLPQR